MSNLWRHCLLSIIITKTEDLWTLCTKKEAETKMLFHISYSVASNNAVVGTVDTDEFIIVLINMENLAANINGWL